MRFPSPSLIVAAVVLLSASEALAFRVAFTPPYQRPLLASTVVVGKVSGFEKDLVEVEERKGGPKVAYRVALVKVENALKGAAGLTHLKVGFVAQSAPGPVPVDPNGLVPIRSGRGPGVPELKEGQEVVLFLEPHATAGFQVMNFMHPPLDLANEEDKKSLESVKRTLAIIANPKAALTAEKAEDRYVAACTMLLKHRQPPRGMAKVEPQPIPAEENALIFKGLLEGDWDAVQADRPPGTISIGMLGLTPKDGFKYPKIQPGQKVGAQFKKALAEWRNGPGKAYVIQAFVAVK